MDSNSQIIAELRAEITELKRRVSVLEEKFNHKEEMQIQDVSKLSLLCVFEPNTSSNCEDTCQNIDQSPVQESADSSALSPVCNSVCSDTEQHSTSALYPNISSVCSFLKKEPDPMEMNEISAFNGIAEYAALPELEEVNIVTPVTKNERAYEVPLGFVCHKGLQTPLKECSVQLVDCGKTLKQITKRATASRKWKCRRSSRVKKIPLGKRLKHPLDCSLCGKTISTASSLKTHKSHHTSKIYQCSQCGRKFYYLHTYTKHKKIHKRKQLHCLNLEKNKDIDTQTR